MSTMVSVPDWPRISSSLYYEDASGAIDWLCRAFGFEVRLKIEGEGGAIEHSELVYGDGVVMVGSATQREPGTKAPSQLDGVNTQRLFVYVDDIEAHHARAVAAGAVVTRPLTTTDYGSEYWTDRSYGCTDPGGHGWYFAQRLRSP